MKRIGYFIVLSIIIHLSLRSGLFTLARYVEARTPKNPLLEVTLVNEPAEESPKNRKFEKPIIKQLDPPADQIINDQSTARFDSEKTQRVKQETRAAQLGLTRNATQKSAEQKPRPPAQQTEGDLPEFARMNFSSPAREQQQSAAISTQLPSDIKLSAATNLNTDANTYYSFYSRVEDLFYVRWTERLDYYWGRLPDSFKKENLSNRKWSTIIEVWLKASGEYHSSYIHKRSGYQPFDEAAVFAFKDSRFFPNPPRAKIEADGFVRLRYRLTVNIGPM